MNIRGVRAVFFSPAGTTRTLTVRLALTLAGRLGVPWEAVDVTLPNARFRKRVFFKDELVIFGFPTYAGKLPNKLLPYLRDCIRGEDTPAAALVTFGNRSFDNAAAELCSVLAGNGFRPLGAGAFVCRHVFSDTMGAGRPDDEDMAELSRFRDALEEKLKGELPAEPLKVPGDADAPYFTPRGEDGEPAKFLKAKPKTDLSLCKRCGRCAAHCPMGAIDPFDVTQVPGTCIKCHACVRGCPGKAKYFDDPAFLSHKAMLENTYQERAVSQWFV